MKKLVIFLAIISGLYANISINEAWQKVLKVDEGLKASEAESLHVQKLKEAKKSLYLPEINIGGSYTRMQMPLAIDTHIPDITIPGLGTLPGKTIHTELQDQDVFIANLSMFYPLYTGGKIDAASDAYEAKANEAKAKHRLEEDKKFLKLIKIYYGVVIANEAYKTRLQAQNALLHHYENAKKLKEAGQIASIELLNARVKLDSAKIETTKAKQTLEITKLALFDMLHVKELPSSTLFINPAVDSVEEFEKKMLESYVAFEILKEKEKQIDALLKIEKADFLPTFYAFGNYLLYKDDSPLMDMTPDWIAGVGVKYNILSRSGTSKKVEATRVLKSKLIHSISQTKSDLKLLVEKTYKEMIQFKEEYEARDSALNMAKENLKLREIAFKEGLATSVEVVDAQTFLTASKTRRLNALYNYVLKISQLAVLSGDKNLFFELEKISNRIEDE